MLTLVDDVVVVGVDTLELNEVEVELLTLELDDVEVELLTLEYVEYTVVVGVDTLELVDVEVEVELLTLELVELVLKAEEGCNKKYTFEIYSSPILRDDLSKVSIAFFSIPPPG